MRYVFLIAVMVVFVMGFAQAQENGMYTRMSAREAKTLVEENRGNPDFVILDIRTLPEYEQGHIDGAVMIDFYRDDFEQKIDALDKEKSYFVYCRSGNRSGQSLKVFKKLGFKKVYELKSGFASW